MPASYHLAVTMDDAADGVTLVTRGADLFAASHVHRTLQALLGLPAVRFAGEADEQAYYRELPVEGLGNCWALPGLELLMDEPERKRALWQAMRRVRQRWLAGP